MGSSYSKEVNNAIEAGNMQELNELLKEKGDLNQPQSSIHIFRTLDVANLYPIEVAAKTSEAMTDKLLAAGAKADVVDDYLEYTPMMYALSTNHEDRFRTAIKLLAAGSDPQQVATNKNTAINLTVQVLDTDSDKAKDESLQLLRSLLRECDVDQVVSRSGTNPLIEAVSYDNYEAAELILSEGIIDVNAKRKGGKKTPLEIARRNNNEAMEKLLIRYGAK